MQLSVMPYQSGYDTALPKQKNTDDDQGQSGDDPYGGQNTPKGQSSGPSPYQAPANDAGQGSTAQSPTFTQLQNNGEARPPMPDPAPPSPTPTNPNTGPLPYQNPLLNPASVGPANTDPSVGGFGQSGSAPMPYAGAPANVTAGQTGQGMTPGTSIPTPTWAAPNLAPTNQNQLGVQPQAPPAMYTPPAASAIPQHPPDFTDAQWAAMTPAQQNAHSTDFVAGSPAYGGLNTPSQYAAIQANPTMDANDVVQQSRISGALASGDQNVARDVARSSGQDQYLVAKQLGLSPQQAAYITDANLPQLQALVGNPNGAAQAAQILNQTFAGPAGINPNGTPNPGNAAFQAPATTPTTPAGTSTGVLPASGTPATSSIATPGAANDAGLGRAYGTPNTPLTPGLFSTIQQSQATGSSSGVGTPNTPITAGMIQGIKQAQDGTGGVPPVTLGGMGQSGTPVQTAANDTTGTVGSGTASMPDILSMLTGGAKQTNPYGTPQVQQAYNWLGGNIDDQYALQRKALDDEAAARGLGVSTIKAGRLNDLNIGQRSAKEALAENLAQNSANTQLATTGQNLNYINSLMGYGQQGFQNDLATNAVNNQAQQNYQNYILQLLGLGYGMAA